MSRVLPISVLLIAIVAVAALVAFSSINDTAGPAQASHSGNQVDTMSIDMDPFNPAESGTDCDNATDDDGDGFVNDGCPEGGDTLPESLLAGACEDDIDSPIDADSAVNDGCPAVGNAATFVGPREECAQINENGDLDADETSVDTVTLDVTAEGIPPFDDNGTPADPVDDFGGMLNFTYAIKFDESNLTLQTADALSFLINVNNGSNGADASVTPGVQTDDIWIATVTDSGPLPGILEDGDGVLHRIEISSDTSATAAVYALDLANNAIKDAGNNSLATDTVNDATIALDTACPVPTDVEVFVGIAAPANATADTPFDVDVDASVQNNGPFGPVDTDVTVTLNLPPDCTADPNSVTIDVDGLAIDDPTAIPQTFPVTCGASSHTFTATVEAETPSDSDTSNDSKTTADSDPPTVVTAESDVEVVSVSVSGPADTAIVDVPFDVTATVTILNNGPFGPVDTRIDSGLGLPSDCSTTDSNPQIFTASDIPLSTPTEVDVTWSVTCTDKSNHDFQADCFECVPNQLHVSDPDDSDNTAVSPVETIPVFAEADVQVSGLTVTAPDTADVGDANDFVVNVDATVHNAGPFGPVTADPSVQLNLPDDCHATAVPAASSVDLPFSTDVKVGGDFEIFCDNPSNHVFSADVSVELSDQEEHVLDPTTGNNSMTEADSTAVFADADLKVVGVTLGVPESITTDEAFDVTVDATLHNNGSFTPVDADATVSLTVPTGCTSVPAGDQVANASLPVSTETAMPQQTWSVTCSDAGSGNFTAKVTVSALHVTDEEDGNDSLEVSVLGVVSAPAATPTPTPTPTATPTAVAGASQLPTTGGEPSDGGLWTAGYVAVVILILGLLAGAGLYGLRRRSRA